MAELDEHDAEYRAFLEASLADISACHAGYFAQDNSDSDEEIAKEVDTILHGKKQLLSFRNKDGHYNTLRFLFSKWTLKEGWDNPNVFTIAKLRSSGSENSKLQEVGRGLRLPVDENGNRIANETFNLNYIVDFTEADFIGPKCCLSFAGNNIAYAHDLLTFIFTTGKFSVDQMLSRALEIHLSAPKDAIEFLICTVDEREEGHITCIKDGEIKQDCPQAWIGSSEVHNALQAQRDFSISKSEHRFSLSQFQIAIERSCDDSVGGFITNIRYDFYNRTFVYSERLETHTGRDQLVQLGESTRLYDNAADGGYLVHYDENSSAFSLQIDQGDLSIVYVNGTKYDEPHSINDHTKYFMIPILVRTSTCEPIYNTIPAGERE